MTTVVITENSTGGTHTGVTDFFMDESNPTVNDNTSVFNFTASFGSGNRNYQCFVFQPPALGTGTVSASSFILQCTDSDGSTHDYEIYSLLRNVVVTEATWNIYSTGNSWGTAGALGSGDRSASALTAAQTIAADGFDVTWSGAGLDAYIETQSNAGNPIRILVARTPDNAYDGTWKRFSNSEHSDSFRPRLAYTHTAGGGSPTFPTPATAGLFGFVQRNR